LYQRRSAADDVATATGLVIDEEWVGRTAVVALSGVVDMLTSPYLDAAITAALAKRPDALIVDLSDVDFLASAGMGVLIAAREYVSPTAAFGVVADGPATSRPLILIGLADLIGIYPTLDEARVALA
jgi:anti-sigma B factor antagonist